MNRLELDVLLQKVDSTAAQLSVMSEELQQVIDEMRLQFTDDEVREKP